MYTRLTVLVFLSLSFAACKPNGATAVAEGPAAPINAPDSQVIQPNTGGEVGSSVSTAHNGTSGNGLGPTSGSTGTGTGTTSLPSGGGNQAGAPVPEPGTLLLLGSGLAGIAGLSRRRRRRASADAAAPVR